MRQFTRKEKAYLLTASYITILFTAIASKHREEIQISYNENYQYESIEPYAYYDDKRIYILTPAFIDEISDTTPNEIYIIDSRDSHNPAMSIYNSYKITNPKEIKTILKILLKFERSFPSKWHRTIKSMENEWYVHDICHFLNYEICRTGTVDLDNDDEDNFRNIFQIIKSLDKIVDNEEEIIEIKIRKLK